MDASVLPTISSSRYTVKLAKDPVEVQAALRLRYEIFGEELDRTPEVDQTQRLDKDQYDDQFYHLVVIDKESGQVIGTYRLQTYERAANGLGFTTNFRFCLHQFPNEVLKSAMEVGRACIAREHRSGMVLYLLWKGLAAYLIYFQKRYLFGYAALDTDNPYTAHRTFDYLKQHDYLHPHIWIERREGFTQPEAWPDSDDGHSIDLPLLFQNYLNVGAQICGGPSFDDSYQLIHFLILLDMDTMAEQTKSRFLNNA